MRWVDSCLLTDERDVIKRERRSGGNASAVEGARGISANWSLIARILADGRCRYYRRRKGTVGMKSQPSRRLSEEEDAETEKKGHNDR